MGGGHNCLLQTYIKLYFTHLCWAKKCWVKKCFSPQGFHFCDELNSQYQGGTYWLTRSWTSSTASTKVVRIDLQEVGRAQQPVPRWFVLTYKKYFSPQGFHYWDELNSQYQGGSYWLTRSASVPKASTTGTSSTASTKVVRIDLQEGLPLYLDEQKWLPLYLVEQKGLPLKYTWTSKRGLPPYSTWTSLTNFNQYHCLNISYNTSNFDYRASSN